MNWFYFMPAAGNFVGENYLIGPFISKANALKHAMKNVALSGNEPPDSYVVIKRTLPDTVKQAFIEAGAIWPE